MSDHLIRAVGLGARVRAIAAVTTNAVERLRSIHDPGPDVTGALGRAATGALLLAAMLEKVTNREPILTVQIIGDGPAGRIVATASPAGWVRAMVANPTATAPARPDGKLNVSGVVGTTGQLVVTRDPGVGEPYEGVVPLTTGEIANDIAHYLNDSEQVPSAVVLGVFAESSGRVGHAGGYMLQVLPGVSDGEADQLTQRVKDLGAVTAQLAQGEGPHRWLERLFPDGFGVLAQVPVRFLCGCSRSRVERALKLLGRDEMQSLLESHHGQPVQLTCEFCKTEYVVPAPDLARLLLELVDEVKS